MFVLYLLLHSHYFVILMAKVQDCFKIEEELKERAQKQSKADGCSRASVYRKALIDYLEKVEKPSPTK